MTSNLASANNTILSDNTPYDFSFVRAPDAARFTSAVEKAIDKKGNSVNNN